MERSLIDELWGGIPALVALVPAVVVIRLVCRRPALRRLRLALSLIALAVSLGVFRRLAPTVAAPFQSYIWVLMSFAGLYLVFKLADVLLFDVFLPRRGQSPPPGIFRDILSTVFAAFVLVMLLQVGLGVHVAAVIVTSAALSIFVGLALQQTISDLFAGVALMIERPFAPGDWVKIGQREGRVREISWRALKIQLLRVDDYLIIPNSVVAKAEIVNMSSPTPLHGHTVEVGVAYGHAPSLVSASLVRTASAVAGVLPAPSPRAELIEFGGSAITYRLTFWIDDYGQVDDIAARLRAHIWYAFQRDGIEMPFPIVHNYTRSLAVAERAQRRSEVERLSGLFAQVDFLSALRPEDLARLAQSSRILPYPAGAVVARRGDVGDSLFVVAAGRVEVLSEQADGQSPRAVAAREVGDYFGEMGLLTGQPRPATIRAVGDTELAVLTSDVLRPILVSDPPAAERLSKTLALHSSERQEAVQRMATESEPPREEVPAHTLLDSIQRFFRLANVRDEPG
ncbi:MAG TPA: mechanosensitive ion channel family protein [Candidatus Methylomirabilis sp.]|nr:mechanosensitive ion channel family protein [Candidatus Methylomirabilis sp.]